MSNHAGTTLATPSIGTAVASSYENQSGAVKLTSRSRKNAQILGNIQLFAIVFSFSPNTHR